MTFLHKLELLCVKLKAMLRTAVTGEVFVVTCDGMFNKLFYTHSEAHEWVHNFEKRYSLKIKNIECFGRPIDDEIIITTHLHKYHNNYMKFHYKISKVTISKALQQSC